MSLRRCAEGGVCLNIPERLAVVGSSGLVATQNAVRHWCVFRKVFRVCVLSISNAFWTGVEKRLYLRYLKHR